MCKGLVGYLSLQKGKWKPCTEWQNHRKFIFHRKNILKISWKFIDILLLVVRQPQRVIWFTFHSLLRTNTPSKGIIEVPHAMLKALFMELHSFSLLFLPASRGQSLSEVLQLQDTVEIIFSGSLLTSSWAVVINQNWVLGTMSQQSD